MCYQQCWGNSMNLPIHNVKFYEYIPGFTIICAVFLSILSGFQSIAWMTIFYWSVFRVDLVPVSLLLAMGLIYDSFCSYYLGLEAFLYLVLMTIVNSDRRFLLRKDFVYLWQSISSLMFVGFLGKWLLSVQLGFQVPAYDQGLDFIFGTVCFPIVMWMFAPIYRRFTVLG